MKRFCRLFIFLIILSGWIPNIAAAQVVGMPDASLAAVVRAELGLAPNARITRQALQRLTFLHAPSWDNRIKQLTGGARIKDLTGLEHATELFILNLNFHEISDLGPLKGLTRLTNLYLTGTEISDLGPLAGLTQLRSLGLHYLKNPINDFSPLTGLKQLTDLKVSVRSEALMGNLRRHVDLTQLQDLFVDGDGNQIGDIGFVSTLKQLRYLRLHRTQLRDITPLRNLTQLEDLWLDDNQISDVTPLADLTQLKWLVLAGNRISDVTPLANLTQLGRLSLAHNQIRDVTPIQHLIDSASTSVSLEGNPIGEGSDLVIENLLAPNIQSIEGNPIGEGSDLVIENFLAPNIQSISLGPNGKRNLSLTVKNQGTAESKATTLKFYRSTDKNISPTDDTLLKAFPIKALPVDGTAKASYTVIATETPTTYYYGACVDSVDGEVKIDNNCTTGIKITVRGQDLVVESVKATRVASIEEKKRGVTIGEVKRYAFPGEPFELHATVRNQGTEKSAKTKLIFYRSTDDHITTGSKADEEIKEVDIAPLLQHGSVNRTLRVHAPKTAGIYYYGACVVGSKGEVNCSTEPAKITVTVPDLQIKSIKVAKKGTSTHSPEDWKDTISVDPGEEFDLRVIVRNGGDRAAGATNVIYYRSSDAEISKDDKKLKTVKNNRLPPSTTDHHIVTFRAPDTHGTYYYGVCVDSVENEIKIDNNCSTAVRIAFDPDLDLPDLWPGFISQVAHSADGYTYFVVYPPHYVNVPGLSLLKFNVKKCSVTLHTPDSGYFMFPLESPKGQKVEEGEKGVRIGLKVTGFIPKAWEEIGYINDIVRSDDPTAYPKLTVTPPSSLWEIVRESMGEEVFGLKYEPFLPPILFLIREPLSSIDITVEQEYVLIDDPKKTLRKLEYIQTWNLKDSTGAAPHAQPVSFADYPPFQGLSPEAREYFLRQFGEPANAEVWQLPEATTLLPNYPNPFNPETWIPYQLAEPADVALTIYNINGRVIRGLDLGHQRAGTYHGRSRAAYWDGRNAVGEPVASGVYFYTLKAGDFTTTRKMLIRK